MQFGGHRIATSWACNGAKEQTTGCSSETLTFWKTVMTKVSCFKRMFCQKTASNVQWLIKKPVQLWSQTQHIHQKAKTTRERKRKLSVTWGRGSELGVACQEEWGDHLTECDGDKERKTEGLKRRQRCWGWRMQARVPTLMPSESQPLGAAGPLMPLASLAHTHTLTWMRQNFKNESTKKQTREGKM